MNIVLAGLRNVSVCSNPYLPFFLFQVTNGQASHSLGYKLDIFIERQHVFGKKILNL